mmetsp:Transcript_56251/g.150071  ORF Transcript_56251/g.150071 Transcript_56251/m.150071 type:complete len:329 (+) Transcript_56251:1738-2724(+)
MHDRQHRGEFLDIQQRRSGDAATSSHEGRLRGHHPHLVLLLLGPPDRAAQPLDQLVDDGLVRLRRAALAGERGQLGGAPANAQVQPQLAQCLEVEQGRLVALRHDHLAGDLRRHVRVAIAVATHPRREDDRAGRQRQRLVALGRHHGVEAPQEVGHRVPEHVRDHGQAVACLLLRRRLRPPQHVGAPHGRDGAAEGALVLGQLEVRGLDVLLGQVPPVKQLGQHTVLGEELVLVHLRRMRREDDLHLLLDERVVDLSHGSAVLGHDRLDRPDARIDRRRQRVARRGDDRGGVADGGEVLPEYLALRVGLRHVREREQVGEGARHVAQQ